jgi:hypothetical protein
MLKHMINDNIVIFHWQEKRVSDNVARISIVGCEDNSLPVLTFRATGFATTFETPQHAEAFVVSNTAGFIHVGNIRGDAYIQDRSIAEQLRLHLVLKTNQRANDTELRTHICQFRHIRDLELTK